MIIREVKKEVLEKEPYQVWNAFIDLIAIESYGLCPRSFYDKGGSVFIARWQSLHEGKEMFRLTGTKIFIPRFQCV